MPQRGRELEAKHGYLPALHLVNRWGDTGVSMLWDHEIVLGHLRGQLPKFPVGTAKATLRLGAPSARAAHT